MSRLTYSRFLFSGLLCFMLAIGVFAQSPTTYPYNGVYDQRDGHYAFTNANIVPSAGSLIKDGTLIIKAGKVVTVTKGRKVPAGAVEVDLDGKYIYPSFIEPFAEYGLPEAKSVGERPDRQPQMISNKKGAYAWNEALKAEYKAVDHFTIDKRKAGDWRKAGFGTINSHQMDGISRGSSVAVSLGENSDNLAVLTDEVAHVLSFSKGKSTQSYPSSRMGAIALLRQTYLDANWYKAQDQETNLSLQAWNQLQRLPQIFTVSDWQNLLRAQLVADEFGVKYIYKGGGDEYQRINAIKSTGASLILPLNFPAKYDLSNPYNARIVTLEQLRHWERAPSNPAAVAQAGINFAFTSTGLDKKTELLSMVRKAIEYGLSEEAALRALTSNPAAMLGLDQKVGELKNGYQASFLITSSPIFDEASFIHHNWVQGQAFVLKPLDVVALSGNYDLKVGNETYKVEAKGKAGKESINIIAASEESEPIAIKHKLVANTLSLRFQPANSNGFVRLSGTKTDKSYSGRGQDDQGNWVSWSMTRTGEVAKEAVDKDNSDKQSKEKSFLGQLTYPLAAYGNSGNLKAAKVLIQNATVWTNETAGIVENTDVLIENGKIVAIGKSLPTAGARIVDGTAKHLTPGIIDEHSHIALTSVNEGSQASSAEVRMTDVIDATDVDIYRQLAGGVTTSQLLHGSANPIGGQSAIIKLRWGQLPQDMIFEAADPFIKFALGENVKQSNWGDDHVIRYPQTRMGVEQVFENYFTRAREYEQAKLAGGADFRKDLELETILEILNSERFITCHSYQQGEINMLMKVAERHGFRVNTFTHILEGYKVADKMAKHGVGGSTFSDWWAYKYEVNEAIPFNAAIMHEQGVTVAINSDDAEMARRLNQEAAKMMLFGGVSEEDALKFVTLNPAKLLHIDDKVGSIKVGKDADLVLWSNNPLSIYAVAENTFVDGIEYYSKKQDEALRNAIRKERNALIQKSLDAKTAGEKTQAPSGKEKRRFHCNSLDHKETEHAH